MKISRVTPWIVDVPPVDPEPPAPDAATPRGPGRQYVFVQVDTDEGITGWGEITTAGQVAYRSVCAALRELAPLVVGQDASQIEAIWQRVFRAYTYVGTRGVATVALSGLDIALWDIRGKALGLPIYQLLGGPVREAIALYTHFPSGSTPEEMGRNARVPVADGVRAIKLDPFAEEMRRKGHYLDGSISPAGEERGVAIVAALLLNPLALLVVLGGLGLASPAYLPGVLTGDHPLARAMGLADVTPAVVVGLALAFGLVAGLFEELGWSGFATPRLLARHGCLAAGLALGLLWATWHLGPDRPGAAAWGDLWPWRVQLWMFAGMVPYRVLMTWVYRHTRSVLLAVLMHAAYTGGQVLLEPGGTGQTQDLLWWGLLGLALGVVVGLVALADRAHLLRPTPRRAGSAPAG